MARNQKCKLHTSINQRLNYLNQRTTKEDQLYSHCVNCSILMLNDEVILYQTI